MRCAQSDMLTRRLYVFGEVSPNKSSMVFIKILYVDPDFSGIRVTRCLVYVYVLQIFVCPFVLFLLAIVLSVLLRYTDSDYHSSNSYCTSRKSIKHCVHWDVLSDPKIVAQQNQLNIFLCSLGYVDPKALHQQNQLNIVFFGIC